MKFTPIKAEFRSIDIPPCKNPHDSVFCLANMKGYMFAHTYYFMDMQNARGLVVDTGRADAVRKNVDFFDTVVANTFGYKFLPKLRGLVSTFPPYPPGMTSAAYLYFSNSPHWITHAGGARFIIGSLSHKDYVEVDLHARRVTNVDPDIGGELLSAHHWVDAERGEDWFMSYRMQDFFERALRAKTHPIQCKIWQRDAANQLHVKWEGAYMDVIDDFRLTAGKRYAVASQIDCVSDGDTIANSKALVVDLETGRHWDIGGLTTGAHAEIDCEEPDVIYVSNHNFKFRIRPVREWVPRWIETGGRIEEIHAITFCGPASLDKYRLTPDGPKFLGRYTRDDFTRGSIHWSFKHRGRRLICTVTAPSTIHLVDTDTMTLWKAIKVNNDVTDKALIFGVYPSQDGERIYVTSTNSEYLQVVNIDDGSTDMVMYFPNHFYLGISHPIRVDKLSLDARA
ncbi:MAG: hypothetical protein HY908_15425 [Myxococcales bacterium]|nr:hypothetical protein [Myxococcales bacterium]